MSTKLRVGIIGCGAIAFNKHLPALKKLDNVEIAAFCNRNIEKAHIAAKQFGADNAKVYEDYRQLLDDKAIDVVYVLTSNKTHSSITIEALLSGKHVMCEKPMAINSKEAEGMIQASKKSGKKLSIALQNRFRPDSQYLHKLCRNGELGEIYFAKAHALRRRAVPVWGEFLNKDMQGGGALIDIGVHALDLTLWLMNNYDVKYVVGNVYNKISQNADSFNVWGSWKEKSFSVEESGFGYVTMKNGATIFLECSWALNILQEDEAKVTLCGTKAGADMLDGVRINGEKYGQLYTLKPALEENSVKFYKGPLESAAEMETRLFIDSIINDKEPYVKPEEVLVVTKIIDAIYESSRTGKPVYFE
ncbi:putative oxidoreductase YcjS [Caloramator mitchellensis]|uniref:Putative oxidoreductase YcjS n=1 Tax=Caloramator mitchellensis TaxID=908809 RepID=A0A0R3JVM9_CALMK|nr:Gfo/Idh/MocA family oxidoreductase [Caloramator mitchellensis]KRQ87623.1 putative oxidoreductase YcjS [Caloramator mitchellensis]